jgi:hypothetical protein
MSDKTPRVEYSEEAGGLVSAVPLCVDKNDQLVPCDSPEANMQVAAPGVPIPPKVAKLYGLTAAKAEPAPEAQPAEPEEEEKPARVHRSQK